MTDFLAFLILAACLVAVTERAWTFGGVALWAGAGMPGLIEHAEGKR